MSCPRRQRTGQDDKFYEYGKWGGGAYNSDAFITNLVEQMVYLLGEDSIIRYAMNVDEEFDTIFFNTFEEKANLIIKNFDKILDLKNKIVSISNKILKEELEQKIERIYEETQGIMINKYYESIASRLVDEKEVDEYREKFFNSKEYVGERVDKKYDAVSFFEEYKSNVMNTLDQRLIKINKEKQKRALVIYNNKLINFLKRKISYFFN